MGSDEHTYHLLRHNRDQGIKKAYELYAPKLFAYATRKWKTPEDDAWDLVYKSIYKVADVVEQYSFTSEEAFAGFLFKVFMNHLRDHVRKEKKQAESMTSVPLTDSMQFSDAAPAPETKPNRSLNILQTELDKLEDWQRILLLMRSQDIAYSEIARYVDKPENQLKSYYARLKKQLMEKVSIALNRTDTPDHE
ncbi:MAG TPA: sigma-70 family RNA polymerase sigma factor [Bacteroidia bacterium]|nr:sigma-70 family RNA polymerase sigma factor [Bacteroidia bacterium]